MTIREKIILSLAFLFSIGYAVYFFTLNSSPKAHQPVSGGEAETVNDFIQKMNHRLKASALSGIEQYILKNASNKWRNPFPVPLLPQKSIKTANAEIPPDPLPTTIFQPVYSGFLQAGGRRIAILDHMEYEIGEQIAGSDYYVINILPGSVTIKARQEEPMTINMTEKE